ncbi:spore germination protein GerPB [Paenibacillus mesotrionivorans]|jgi:spore germination protein PB|uniref:Spore germination protein GerPB n=1 Tax=Paenibacillus mesotrionivorans TaxID=3160968 RepID=A0ACC7NUK2_9BACL
MIVNVYQTITIRSLTISSLANSSVFQVGSAGLVKSLSNNFNTGGFTSPAPELGDTVSAPQSALPSVPLVPLPALRYHEAPMK